MAEDNILRSYRSNEPARRAPAPARDAARDAGGGDPLAELARLIGQSDPFADSDRTSRRSAEARQQTDASPSDWRQTAAALARESMRDAPTPDPHFDQVDSAVAAAKSLRAQPREQFAHPAAPTGFDQDLLAPADYADSAYDREPHIDADDRFHDAHGAETQPSDHESENYFLDGAAVPADDRFYDDPPRSRAANGVLTAIVLVGCGILGTAGAYGYRTYYSGVRPTDAPIIAAEKAPNKVVPASSGSDSGKSIQDRIGEKAVNERVVARQEEPVTFAEPSGPRVVLPAPFTTSPGPGPSVQSNSGAPAAATEPKKVRTVPIRPEGVDPTARPLSAAAGAPLQTAPSAPIGPARQSPPPAAKPVSPPRNGNTPLSLEAQGQAGDTASSYQQPAPRERTAAAAPISAPRLASAATAPAGGYVVQISSQRSEAEAQTSFHSLQSKFPKELGDREAIVRRADLGPKGIYYRAMVGPFESAGDADQLCGSLKAAGAQCIVQKN